MYPILRHPLREDVSWNNHRKIVWIFVTSSSSWGCELKYAWIWWHRDCGCHPLREDVSWNYLRDWWHEGSWVILFVRMWVEISILPRLRSATKSSSSWGCELKYGDSADWDKLAGSSSSWGCELKCRVATHPKKSGRHPLREDVSWNNLYQLHWKTSSVILFVRMWVEIWPHT